MNSRHRAAILGAAWPSPNGIAGCDILRNAAGSRRNRFIVATIRLGSVPTNSIDPQATPSGRSVFSRRTSSGTPSAGASSCIPPESDSTRSAFRMAWMIAG